MASLRHNVAAVLVASVAAQLPAPPVSWFNARGGVVRDKLYIEGGLIGYNGELAGTTAYLTAGTGWSVLNFSTPFDQNTDWAALFAANNVTNDPLARLRLSGFMFADGNEWYTVGGRAYTTIDDRSGGTHITRDGVYKPDGAGVENLGVTPNFQPPEGNMTTSNSTFTWDVTNGAGVNVPSEQVGFYFSGLRSQTGDDLSYIVKANDSAHAPSQLADTMLKVNMTSPQSFSEWSMIPLPDIITPRADAVSAWVPVGAQGAVIIIGGVQYPSAVMSPNGCNLKNDTLKGIDNTTSAGFIEQVSVYDVATGEWYLQGTLGDRPPQLAQACAVVASSEDNSVHNIYVYGGYDGVSNNKDGAYDDVWILSVPSFTWIKAYDGTTTRLGHGRFAHLCAKPYPDQMIVVGGTTQCNGALGGPFADVFNLTTLTWTGAYNPTTWSNYTVPTKVSDAISTSPTAALMQTGLLSLLSTRYAGGVARADWYPYELATTSTPSPSPTPQPGSSRSWVVPVAVVIPIVALLALGAMIWFLMRRRRSVASQSGQSRRSIGAWIRGQPSQPKSVFSDGETTQISHGTALYEAPDETYFKAMHHSNVAELNSDPNTPSHLGTPYASPRGPMSPSSPASELHSQSAYAELPGSPQLLTAPQNFKNHPMYPPSISGHAPTTTSESVSSPATGPANNFKLPESVIDQSAFLQAPNEMLLGSVGHTVASSTTRSPHVRAADSAGDVSPEIGPVASQTEHEDLPTPNTPVRKPVGSGNVSKAHSHTRNASSLSEFSESSAPNPQEDQHHSTTTEDSSKPSIEHTRPESSLSSSGEARHEIKRKDLNR